MSWRPAKDADCAQAKGCPPVDLVIVPRSRDIGGFEVRRALPAKERRMVGPFIFFDQMGPAVFPPGAGMDVRPHPHIGLSTLTWLFEGEILHRDSLGFVQPIRPGEVNWMTAGSGIVHSERTPPEARTGEFRAFGLQIWMALPREKEEMAPGFQHYAAESLPVIEDGGVAATLVGGTAWGETSPVAVHSDTIYADIRMAQGGRLPVPGEHEERALYVLEGVAEIAGDRFEAGSFLVLRPGDGIAVEAPSACRLMLLGGATADGPRHIWWNFVSHSKERIEQAKADWRAGRFDPVPDETEFIPLPED
ncbi:MAG: pirin family protein [Rhodospirillaceae bacterium]|nr:pirin family protein [Rhodospirillaceae bacterium]MBT6118123.1 pirin family protein [Rhodospirillaceae bacterium]